MFSGPLAQCANKLDTAIHIVLPQFEDRCYLYESGWSQSISMNNLLDDVWWVNFKFFPNYLTYVWYIIYSLNYLPLSL